jgi:Tfp pilus assembly protein PilP
MIRDLVAGRLWALLGLGLALGLAPAKPAAGAGPMDSGSTPAAPTAPASDGGVGAGGPASDAAAAKRLAALRKKVLKDDDFVENDEINRDPFHSYLRLFVDRGAPKVRKVVGVFDKAGLDELTLIAVITGDDNPRAMFRDAAGFGQSVKKGDFLSRAGARVTKILSDRVIVELSEQSGTGEARVIEKAILVNPDGAR